MSSLSLNNIRPVQMQPTLTVYKNGKAMTRVHWESPAVRRPGYQLNYLGVQGNDHRRESRFQQQ